MTHGIIVGGGISGLAAAIFAQEQGLTAEVYERNRAVSSDDHLLWIAPNGLHLLKRLGLAETVLSAALPQEAMVFATRALRPLMTLHGASLRASCDFPIVAVRRCDLWEALERRWRSCGGDIHYGHAITEIEDLGAGQGVRCTGDFGVRMAPWLIGADGMGSKVRETLGQPSRVGYQGIRTWLGRSVSPVAANYVGRTIEAWGQGTRFVLTSLDGKRVYFSALERAALYEKNAAPIPDDTLPRLQAAFATYHPDVTAVLEAADPRSLVRCNFGVVTGLERPYRGRIAVIGDAAHGMPPNMGQGASLGLEDALWITHHIARNKDPGSAFACYAAGRRRRIREMRSLANAMNGLFQPEKAWACLVRDSVAALIPDFLTAKRMGHLYQPAFPHGVLAT